MFLMDWVMMHLISHHKSITEVMFKLWVRYA